MNDFSKLVQATVEKLDVQLQIIDRCKAFLSEPANIQSLGLWLSAIVAALVSVAYTRLFNFAEAIFFQKASHHSFVVLLLSPILFLSAWYLVRRFAPEAGGSGIPQIMAANEIEYVGENRLVVDRLLSLPTAAIKILSSLLCVLGGGAIGREGPTLQICSSIFHFFGKKVRSFSPSTDEHTWIVAGAAAGLASAFNTPLGGIVYAIEELGLVHFHKIRTALISGVIISGLVVQWILGTYLYLGYPQLTPVGFSFLPAALLAGALSGAAGGYFGKILLFLLKKRLAIRKLLHVVLVTALCGLAVAIFSIVDARVSGTGVNIINELLFKRQDSDLSLIALRFGGTLVSYLSGASGGIFSPSLAIGASIGSYLAKWIATDHANLMILLGMIGFLTGVTRTPFTSFILVLEMTDRHSAIFPMMLAALSANGISRLVDARSFYEHVKEGYIQSFKVSQSTDSPDEKQTR